MKKVFIILLLTLPLFGFSQQSELDVQLLEVNVGPGSKPVGFYEFQEDVFFTANDGVNGRELWRANGGEPLMVYDLAPGAESAFNDSNRDWCLVGTEFFLFSTLDNGFWKSDGTEAGTVRLFTKATPQFISYYAELNSMIYFAYDDDVHGVELWKTDGTPEGTVLVKDINQGSAKGIYSKMINFKGHLYFFANDGTHGTELWRSDGTASGTYMLKDINQGQADGAVISGDFLVTNDYLFFYGFTNGFGRELWVTDGAEVGTRMVKDINPGGLSSTESGTGLLGAAGNGFILFRAMDSQNSIGKLWISDGTENGTKLVYDFAGGFGIEPLWYMPFGIVEFNGKFYFEADGGDLVYKLWVSDGTTEGTYQYTDMNPGHDEYYDKPAIYNGSMYFIEHNIRKNIYITEGLDVRIFLNWPTQDNVFEFLPLDDKIYLSARQDSYFDGELMTCKEGNQDLRVMRINTTFNSNSAHFYNFDEKVIFFANSDGIRKLHITDGTPEGTHIIKKDPDFGIDQNHDARLYRVGENLFFASNANQPKLVKTDGTPEGTGLLLDASEGAPPIIGLQNYGKHNGIFYFNARHSGTPLDLFRSDGTPEGTYRVKNLSGSPDIDSFILSYEEWNGYLYFSGGLDDKVYPYQTGTYGIWRTDGTEAGTEFVIQVPDAGLFDSGPTSLRAVNDKLFFVKREYDQASYGPSTVYVTDGTQQNILKLWGWDGNVIDSYKAYANLVRFGDKVFFSSRTPQGMSGFETIIVSDGTVLGTHPIDTNLGFNGIRHVTKCGNSVYFLVAPSGGIDNGDIWKTDGTPENTTQITNYVVDRVSGISCYKGKLVFVESFAYRDQFGVSSDSGVFYVKVTTEDGYDINNYEGLKSIFAGEEENLYFTIYNRKRGNELYGVDASLVLSTDEINEALDKDSADILLFPNPAENEVNLKTADNSKIRQIQVYDLTGRLNEIILRNSEEIQINLVNYKSGIYILKIKTDKNAVSKKLIVK